MFSIFLRIYDLIIWNWLSFIICRIEQIEMKYAQNMSES